jgi:3-hydroxybutyryl-CoA dehydrogenase
MADDLERIAVIGAGLMGTSIGLDWARAGHRVAIYDADPERARSVPERAREVGAMLVGGGVLDASALEAAVLRLTPTPDLADTVGSANYVAEAIVEHLPTKQALFGELDALCGPDTVLASNTSSLMPSALAAPAQHRERVLVVHYFNPAHLIPVVEVVRGPETSDATVEMATRLLRQAGKTPAVLRKEVPGFIANRLQSALLREALALVEDGVASMEDLDAVVSQGFGRRLAAFGPFAIADMAGLDVWQAITSYLFPLLSDADTPPPLLADRAEAGELGLKTGRGFYSWSQEDARAALARRDAELLRHLAPDRG